MIVPRHLGQKAEPCNCLCHDPDYHAIMHCFGPRCCAYPQVKHARRIIDPAVVKAAAADLARKLGTAPWLKRIEWSSRPAMITVTVDYASTPNFNTLPRDYQGIRVEWHGAVDAGDSRKVC